MPAFLGVQGDFSAIERLVGYVGELGLPEPP